MKIQPKELLYKILTVIITLDAALYSTTLSGGLKRPIHLACLLCTLLFTPLCVWLQKNGYKQFFISMVLLLFGVISYGISGNTDILVSIIFVVLAWEVDADEILGIIYRVRLVVFACTILLAAAGVLELGTIATSSADKGVLLGYGHANTFAGNAGLLVFLALAVHRKHLKPYHLVAVAAAGAFIFVVSRSRTSLILIALLILMSLLSFLPRGKRILLKMGKIFMPVLVAVIFLLIGMRSVGLFPRFVDIADRMLNGRLLLAAMNLEYYPVTLLGQKVDSSIIAAHHQYYVLDNGYAYILVHYGIAGVCVICGLAQMALYTCVKKKEYMLLILSICVLIWMVYEGMMISATSNFTLLFAMTCIWSKVEKESTVRRIQI